MDLIKCKECKGTQFHMYWSDPVIYSMCSNCGQVCKDYGKEG